MRCAKVADSICSEQDDGRRRRTTACHDIVLIPCPLTLLMWSRTRKGVASNGDEEVFLFFRDGALDMSPSFSSAGISVDSVRRQTAKSRPLWLPGFEAGTEGAEGNLNYFRAKHEKT